MNLVQELNRTKNSIGLVSGRLRINEYNDADTNISAGINPRDWNIEFNLRKDYEPIQDRRQKAYARAKKIKDGKKAVLEDILHHELAHWELPFNSGFGCPFDAYHQDIILESVKQALPEDKQQFASYVTNAFADMLINSRCKEFKGDFSGQVLFWDNEGLAAKEEGQAHYTEFYEAFVKLNMHLWGDNVDRTLLKRHYSNSKEVDDAVSRVVQQLNLPEDIQDTSPLFAKERWQNMASVFARNLAELLEEGSTERLSAYLSESDPQAGNGIEQKLGTKDGKEEVAYGRYKGNNPLSPNISSYEQLDSLYRKLAIAIPVQVEAMTHKHDLAIGALNFRAFDPETDDIRKAKPTKLYADEDGLTFGYQREPLTIEARSKIQRRSFPDFKLVILDNSGSMESGINGNNGNTTYISWGDNSKYHYGLLGFYGVEQFLQAQGIAQYIGHGLSLFSSSTRYEETDYKDLQKLRKLALSPEFGGTRIDANILLDALRGRESFVLSISDGEIDNWADAKQEFEKLARENYFAHIQIGPKNRFTHDLEANKFPVFYVTSGQELSRLMVTVATNTYRKFTQE